MAESVTRPGLAPRFQNRLGPDEATGHARTVVRFLLAESSAGRACFSDGAAAHPLVSALPPDARGSTGRRPISNRAYRPVASARVTRRAGRAFYPWALARWERGVGAATCPGAS